MSGARYGSRHHRCGPNPNNSAYSAKESTRRPGGWPATPARRVAINPAAPRPTARSTTSDDWSYPTFSTRSQPRRRATACPGRKGKSRNAASDTARARSASCGCAAASAATDRSPSSAASTGRSGPGTTNAGGGACAYTAASSASRPGAGPAGACSAGLASAAAVHDRSGATRRWWPTRGAKIAIVHASSRNGGRCTGAGPCHCQLARPDTCSCEQMGKRVITGSVYQRPVTIMVQRH
jgi:hypothetical protein